jgi:hypothetical protein
MVNNAESPILGPMKGNPRIRSAFLLDNFYKSSNSIGSSSLNNGIIAALAISNPDYEIERKFKLPQKSMKLLQS